MRGEISGTEDLFIDGQVDGVVDLPGSLLTVGPQGQVKANILARNIVVSGRVEGNMLAGERVELRKSAVVIGDVVARRIVIEEGAFVKGSLDVQKDVPKDGEKDASRAPTSGTVTATATEVATPSLFGASATQR